MRHDPAFHSTAVLDSAKRLGERIRATRKAQKRTLVELEKACRVHRQTLARLERGDPGVSIGVMLSVLEALRELADVELLVSQPGVPVHQRSADELPLERDF
jgi:transcriptional regulator with XRE-family HTH domain